MKQQHRPEERIDTARRRWLGSGVRATGAAAAAAASLPLAQAPAAAAPAAATPAEPAGYHETEHVRDYYRLARY